MNYTDIENFTTDKGDEEYEETVINWRMRRGKVELRCPYCDEFFRVPAEMQFDENGYASTSLYHFCDDPSVDMEATARDGWTVVPHLVGYENV